MPSYRYPGPRPFEENDINLFFGRDRDIKNLLTFINVEQLTVLFSKSGLGKSSLVNAGIIPELRKKKYEIILCRFNSYVNKERDKNIGTEPQSPLQKLFSEVTAKFKPQPTFLDKIVLNTDPFSLWHQFKNVQINSTEKKTYFIFFDQFEELFTYPPEQVKEFKEHLAELLGASIPQEYLDQISQQESDASSADLSNEQLGLLYDQIPIKILATIRSDKFSLLTNLKDAIPGIVTKTYELKPFNTTEATEAIRKPASIAYDAVEDNFISNSFTYDDDAIKKMLGYLSDGGTEDIESFQLQVLCRYVEDMVIENKNQNNELRNITATQLGDIKNIFEAYYNKLIEGIDKDKVQNVKRLFEDGLIFEKDKMRISLYEGQIEAGYGVDEALLNKLVSTHLIRCEPDSNGKEKYELSHDSLIEPILKAKEKRMVEETAVLQKTKTKKRIQLFAAVMAGVILILGSFFYVTLRNAAKQTVKLNFLEAQKDWFYLLDQAQRDYVLQSDYLSSAKKDSGKYNTSLYSFKCAAYTNQYSESNFSLALRFAQEGFLKDSNYVIIKSFSKLTGQSKLNLPLMKIQCSGTINNACITKDGQTVIATTGNGIFRFDAKTGTIKDSLVNLVYELDYSAFSPDKNYVIFKDAYGDTTYFLNLLTMKYIPVKNYFNSSYSGSYSGAIAKDNSFFIHTTADNVVSQVSSDGKLRKKYNIPISSDDYIKKISISPEQNYFIVATLYGELFSVDLKNSSIAKFKRTADDMDLSGSYINSVSFSPDGKFILIATSDNKIQIFDSKTRKIVQTIDNKTPVDGGEFSSDNNHILISSKEPAMISFWSKQNSGDIQNANSRNSGSDTLKFYKDTLELLGLDSTISSINFYRHDSNIIASSHNKILLWNLNSNETSSLQIDKIINSGMISPFSLNEKISLHLISFQDLLSSNATKNEILNGIKILVDSLSSILVLGNKPADTSLTNLIPQLYNHLKDRDKGKLNKSDSFVLFDYMSNYYQLKMKMNRDTTNAKFGKEDFKNQLKFRSLLLGLDTLQHECFQNLLNVYETPAAYYLRSNQYDSCLVWVDKILADNPQLKNIKAIQTDITTVNLQDVVFNIFNKKIDTAKKILSEWPGSRDEDIGYILGTELMEIFSSPNYSFNKTKFHDSVKKFDLTDVSNMRKLEEMDSIIYVVINESSNMKIDRKTLEKLKEFETYLYSLSESSAK